MSHSIVLDHFDFECPIFYKYLPMCIPYVIALAHDMDGGSTTGTATKFAKSDVYSSSARYYQPRH